MTLWLSSLGLAFLASRCKIHSSKALGAETIALGAMISSSGTILELQRTNSWLFRVSILSAFFGEWLGKSPGRAVTKRLPDGKAHWPRLPRELLAGAEVPKTKLKLGVG